MTRRRHLLLAAATTLAVGLGPSASAGTTFPEVIPLPAGFYPEGIAIGDGHRVFVGSLLDGAVWAGDLRTGEGSILAPGVEGRLVVGLQLDERSGLLWGAGAEAGEGRVFAFDADTGETVAAIEVPQGAFLNDLEVTRTTVHVTDSFADVLWQVPLNARGLPSGPAEALQLTGDFTFIGPDDVGPGELAVNLNGIDATANGRTLVAVHTGLGELLRINPRTGEATKIDVGAPVPSGDGIVLHGRQLHVVQNFLNQVTTIQLDPSLTSGTITDAVTSDLFRIPTTGARFGGDLYVVNARFDEAFPPIFGAPVQVLDYEVVRVP